MRLDRRGPRSHGLAGFTLIELLVALALMAVVSLLGWRGLDTVLRSQDRIVARSDAMRALSVAFGQLEEDLRRSWPVRVPGAQPIGFRSLGEDGLVFEVLREAPGGAGASVQRVFWRLREGTLERGFSVWMPEALSGQDRSAVTPVQWQALVSDLSGLTIRGFVSGQGWLGPQALSMRPGATPGAPALQVTGVEVTLEQQGGLQVLRVFTVRD